MGSTPVTGTLMRIFVDESEQSGNRPLYMAVVEKLRTQGFSGATVFKGIEGFGSHRQVHAARAFDFSTNLPVLIEVVETEERIAEAIPLLRELISEGLITLEKVQMITIHKSGE